MKRLNPKKLHVSFKQGVSPKVFSTPRRYTLTHSDRVGDLFLTIGSDFNKKQISGFLTQFMRDEALGEWKKNAGKPELHVYCHVSGGLVLGSAKWRNSILRREMPLVLEVFRFGDKELFETASQLDLSPIRIHFRSANPKFNTVENWGTPRDYK